MCVCVCVCVCVTDRQSRSAGVAPEMNLINPLHAGITHITLITHKREILFEAQVRRHQKSKTGLSVAVQKGLISSISFNLCSYWTYSMKCCVIQCK